MGTMSHDRVVMTLESRKLQSCRYLELLNSEFGIKISKMDYVCELMLIMRPSQFARFLIRRDATKLTNDFKAIKPRLISNAQYNKMVENLISDEVIACSKNIDTEVRIDTLDGLKMLKSISTYEMISSFEHIDIKRGVKLHLSNAQFAHFTIRAIIMHGVNSLQNFGFSKMSKKTACFNNYQSNKHEKKLTFDVSTVAGRPKE